MDTENTNFHTARDKTYKSAFPEAKSAPWYAGKQRLYSVANVPAQAQNSPGSQ
jgi:hypothetical protein